MLNDSYIQLDNFTFLYSMNSNKEKVPFLKHKSLNKLYEVCIEMGAPKLTIIKSNNSSNSHSI